MYTHTHIHIFIYIYFCILYDFNIYFSSTNRATAATRPPFTVITVVARSELLSLPDTAFISFSSHPQGVEPLTALMVSRRPVHWPRCNKRQQVSKAPAVVGRCGGLVPADTPTVINRASKRRRSKAGQGCLHRHNNRGRMYVSTRRADGTSVLWPEQREGCEPQHTCPAAAREDQQSSDTDVSASLLGCTRLTQRSHWHTNTHLYTHTHTQIKVCVPVLLHSFLAHQKDSSKHTDQRLFSRSVKSLRGDTRVHLRGGVDDGVPWGTLGHAGSVVDYILLAVGLLGVLLLSLTLVVELLAESKGDTTPAFEG